MPRTEGAKDGDYNQSERFNEAAREIGCDEFRGAV